MAASARVVIVGGGVTGLSTAYHLAQRSGVEVVLLEKGPVGDGSSTRAGGICTSQLWAQVPIQVRVIALRRFKELSEELPDYTYHDVGCLNLFDPEELELRLEMKKLWDQYGVANELLDADEMRRRWPALVIEDDIHGFLDERGGYSEPDEYVQALAAGCRRRGVDIREFTAISEPAIESGRCTGCAPRRAWSRPTACSPPPTHGATRCWRRLATRCRASCSFTSASSPHRCRVRSPCRR